MDKIGLRYGCTFNGKIVNQGDNNTECSCSCNKTESVIPSGTGYPEAVVYGANFGSWAPDQSTEAATTIDTKMFYYPEKQCDVCKTVEVLQSTIQTLLGLVESFQLQVEQLSRRAKVKKKRKITL